MLWLLGTLPPAGLAWNTDPLGFVLPGKGAERALEAGGVVSALSAWPALPQALPGT